MSIGYSGVAFKEVDLKMTVGGIDLSGIFSLAQRFFSERNGLQLSVNYEDASSVVVGTLEESKGSIWLAGSDKTGDIIDRVAYYLAYQRFIEVVKEAEAITPEEFKDLMLALKKVKELNRLISRGRQPEQQTFEEIITTLDSLAQKTPTWSALLHVTAETAENAKNTPKALDYYKLEYAQLQKDPQSAEKEAQSKHIQNKIALLTKELEEKIKLSFPTATTKSEPETSSITERSATERLLDPVRRLIGYVPNQAENPRPVRVAILGGVPPKNLLKREQMEVLNSPPADAENQESYLTDYTASVTQAVLLSAPQAHFVFSNVHASSGGMGTTALLGMIEDLVKAKPDILVITYGPLEGKVFENVFERITKSGILVLLAAGNEPKRPFPFAGLPILNKIMVVSSVDEKGLASSFSPSDPKSFWAPGEKIPVQKYKLQDGKFNVETAPEFVSGTSFATAVAAGIAATVLSVRALSPDEVIKLLRETAVPFHSATSTAPAILNQKMALAKLADRPHP